MPARTTRFLIATLVVTLAVVLQVTVLARLPLPGATPDLVVVVVAAWALRRGSIEGAIVGFAAGLLMDVAPPSDTAMGLSALVLALTGYLVGLAADDAQRSAVLPLVVVGVAALGSLALRAAVGALIGDPRMSGASLAGQLIPQALYAVVLAPFVLPLVHGLLARAEPATSRW